MLEHQADIQLLRQAKPKNPASVAVGTCVSSHAPAPNRACGFPAHAAEKRDEPASPHGLSPSGRAAPYHIIEWEAVFVHHSKIGGRLTALGHNPKLPHCNSNGRFSSVSGHKGRRSWMMRALRILDSPCAPTLGIRRYFQDNLLPVSRVRRRGQAVLLSKREQPLPRLVAPA